MDTRSEITARGPSALIRGWAMATVATVPAAALHGGVHGHAPTALTLLVAIALSAAVCVPLVGKKFTRFRSGAAIFASQALFHTFFSMTGTGEVTVVAATSGHAHHAMQGPIDISVSGAGMDVTMWMLAAHVVAALITVGLVWYGEALVRGILGAVKSAVANLSALVLVAGATLALSPRTRIHVRGDEPRLIASRVAELIQGRAPPVCV